MMTREETMTVTNDKQKEKIKTPFAKVIVEDRGANSYFSILYFDPAEKDFHIGYSSYYLDYVFNWLNEEFEIVEDGNFTLTASREQVEKIWRGEWIHKRSPYDYKIFVCKKCGKQISIQGENMDFCPACGAAQTDEAVQMVMERLEALHETT